MLLLDSSIQMKEKLDFHSRYRSKKKKQETSWLL